MTVEPNEERPLGRTVACDPQNPSFVKTLNAAGELETILADTGVGCHPLEVTALLQLLTSHDEHHKNMDHTDSWRSLSNSYRAAVRDCILKWKDQASSDQDMENLQYTEKIYETMHLSEIFLPLISENWEHSDPYSKPGYVTAATVKWYVVRPKNFVSFLPPFLMLFECFAGCVFTAFQNTSNRRTLKTC